jgi:hypothetical protein
MTASATINNPYWDAVHTYVTADRFDGAPVIDLWPLDKPRSNVERTDMVKRYAWTITDPDTVAFVAKHSNGRIIDPLAGTGYWGWLLAQHGIDAVSYDLNPPEADTEHNQWHRNVAAHSTVHRLAAAEAVALHPDRTLLLAWPPYDEPVGAKVLNAYRGDRVIYIGEGNGGCCGDDDMFAALERDWAETVDHRPVQWFGMHDWVTVYDRRTA